MRFFDFFERLVNEINNTESVIVTVIAFIIELIGLLLELVTLSLLPDGFYNFVGVIIPILIIGTPISALLIKIYTIIVVRKKIKKESVCPLAFDFMFTENNQPIKLNLQEKRSYINKTKDKIKFMLEESSYIFDRYPTMAGDTAVLEIDPKKDSLDIRKFKMEFINSYNQNTKRLNEKLSKYMKDFNNLNISSKQNELIDYMLLNKNIKNDMMIENVIFEYKEKTSDFIFSPNEESKPDFKSELIDVVYIAGKNIYFIIDYERYIDKNRGCKESELYSKFHLESFKKAFNLYKNEIEKKYSDLSIYIIPVVSNATKVVNKGEHDIINYFEIEKVIDKSSNINDSNITKNNLLKLNEFNIEVIDHEIEIGKLLTLMRYNRDLYLNFRKKVLNGGN